MDILELEHARLKINEALIIIRISKITFKREKWRERANERRTESLYVDKSSKTKT